MSLQLIKLLCEKEHLNFKSCERVAGGDINEAYKLESDRGNLFVKINNARRFRGMFEKEAKGLELLMNNTALKVPKPLVFGESNSEQYLLMEWLEPARSTRDFWIAFGSGLAALHKKTCDRFGWETDNYIGSLLQSNHYGDSWRTSMQISDCCLWSSIWLMTRKWYQKT